MLKHLFPDSSSIFLTMLARFSIIVHSYWLLLVITYGPCPFYLIRLKRQHVIQLAQIHVYFGLITCDDTLPNHKSSSSVRMHTRTIAICRVDSLFQKSELFHYSTTYGKHALYKHASYLVRFRSGTPECMQHCIHTSHSLSCAHISITIPLTFDVTF